MPNLNKVPQSKSGLFARVSLLLSGGLAVSALGSWVGRDLHGGGFWVALALFILGAFAVPFVAHKSVGAGVAALTGWVFVSGLFIGPAIHLAVAQLGWQIVLLAYLGTGAVMAGCGAIGALSGRNFSGFGRVLFPALLALIAVGFVGCFVHLGHIGNLIYAGAGMLIFAGYFIFDFFRLSESENTWENAISVTMSLYLDFVNFLLSLLRLLLELLGSAGDWF